MYIYKCIHLFIKYIFHVYVIHKNSISLRIYVFLKNSISNSACRDTKRSFPISLQADAYLLTVLSVKLKVGVSGWFLCHDAFSLVVCATCFSPLSA